MHYPTRRSIKKFSYEKDLFSFTKTDIRIDADFVSCDRCIKKISTLKAWITGYRNDQSSGTCTDILVIQVDPAFKGVSESPLIKYN